MMYEHMGFGLERPVAGKDPGFIVLLESAKSDADEEMGRA